MTVVTLADLMEQETEALNQVISVAEEAFRKLGYGVLATLELRPGVFLSFEKQGKTWGLHVRRESEDGCHLLSSVSREDRILAAARFSELREELQKNTRIEIERVRAASASIQKFLDELEGE